MWSAGQGDDKERFLADLRALRDAAALGFDELAARAHYPSDILKEAENGPSMPGLPILAAYVRACDGDVPEWEERWRRLGLPAGADPGLPVRPAGASPAAVAGARAGVSVVPPDAYDPERIRAALRGSHLPTGKATQAGAGQQTASPSRGDHDGSPSSVVYESPAGRGGWEAIAAGGTEAGLGADSRWDARPGVEAGVDQGSTATNGNHHVWQRDDAPRSVFTEMPDAATTAEALRRDPFSSSWLDDSQPIPPVPDTDREWQDRADTGRAPAEDVESAAGWMGFWTPVKGAAAPADVQQPDAPQAEEPAAAETTWSAFAPSLPKITADPAYQPGADLPSHAEPADPAAELAQAGVSESLVSPAAAASSAASARSQPTARPTVPQPAPAPPGRSRPDRYYPLRLLAVIVVAALIGSVLVLIIR